MNPRINIAIDGYSSCGKGTLAKMLARKLSYIFIDTGAMYRAVTYALIQREIDIKDEYAVAAILPELRISFTHDPATDFYRTILNDTDIENEIRGMQVSNLVSPVSKIDAVRKFLLAQQQEIGLAKGVVMDGRDIGTVVFPDAELKIFMTARPEIRAERRLSEMRSKGDDKISFEEVLNNLTQRDEMDSKRENSPLKAAADARVLDNSDISREQQFEIAFGWAQEVIASV